MDITEALHLGVQGKYTGKRFSTDVNDESVLRTTPCGTCRCSTTCPCAKKNSYAQLNVNNLFDETYLGSISTRTNAVALTGVGGQRCRPTSSARRAPYQVTLRTEF